MTLACALPVLTCSTTAWLYGVSMSQPDGWMSSASVATMLPMPAATPSSGQRPRPTVAGSACGWGAVVAVMVGPFLEDHGSVPGDPKLGRDASRAVGTRTPDRPGFLPGSGPGHRRCVPRCARVPPDRYAAAPPG